MVIINKRYRIYRVELESLHPDNRWYVYDFADGAIARLRDGTLAYTKTRQAAELVIESLEVDPVWIPDRPTYGSLQAFHLYFRDKCCDRHDACLQGPCKQMEDVPQAQED